jgi:hypothetical protein
MRKSRPARGLLRPRASIVLLAGLALATSLAFGFIPTVFRAYAERRVVSYYPRLVDLVSLGLNIALLIALVWVGRPHRDPPEAKE